MKFLIENFDDYVSGRVMLEKDKVVSLNGFTEKFNLERIENYFKRMKVDYDMILDEKGHPFLKFKPKGLETQKAVFNKVKTILKNAGFTGLVLFYKSIFRIADQKDGEIV